MKHALLTIALLASPAMALDIPEDFRLDPDFMQAEPQHPISERFQSYRMRYADCVRSLGGPIEGYTLWASPHSVGNTYQASYCRDGRTMDVVCSLSNDVFYFHTDRWCE